MALLEIIEYPHPTLLKVAKPLDPSEINDAFRVTVSNMLETMYEAPGVGLAAPQVNISKRFLVIDVSGYSDKWAKPLCLINPEIILKEGSAAIEEGCLSLPEFYEKVDRFKRIQVKYLDEFGKEQLIDDDDFLAIVIQHEIDHLDGIVAADRVSPMKKQMWVKKLQKARRKNSEDLAG